VNTDPLGATPAQLIAACILDVDGVLLASPHEQAWREALAGFADPSRFTSEIYQAQVAGKPRLSGALAALTALDVEDAELKAAFYAERKQARLEALVAAGAVAAFPDALRFVQALATLDLKMAVASSSRNANQMMQSIRLASGRPLLDAFAANVCGRALSLGKPNPEIFLLASRELGVPPGRCLVIEDAPAGIAAGRSGGMRTVGVARRGDRALLEAARADLVIGSLDEIALDQLAVGRLSRCEA
jgi:HAD superfamily hydrolase (TIGR01509 family)